MKEHVKQTLRNRKRHDIHSTRKGGVISYQEGEITFFFGVHLTQPIQIDFQSKTGVSKTKSVTLKSTRNTSVFGEI